MTQTLLPPPSANSLMQSPGTSLSLHSRVFTIEALVELVVANVGGCQPRLANERAKRDVHGRRRPRDISARIGAVSRHRCDRNFVNKAAREGKPGVIGLGTIRDFPIRQGHGHRQSAGKSASHLRKLGKEESVVPSPYSEKCEAAMALEVAVLHGVRENRHHSRNAATTRDNKQILTQGREERRSAQRPEYVDASALSCLAEQPVGKLAARLALHEQIDQADAGRKIRDRVPPIPGNAGHLQCNKLTGF